MQTFSLESFFNPEKVAIVGASENPSKIGYSVLNNLLNAGFAGEIYPVNPKADYILDMKVYNKIGDLPKNPDLAVLTVPRDAVIPAFKELAEIKTRSAVVITAGFKEVGKEGYYLENELVQLSRDYNIPFLGPNCLGMINTGAKMDVTFTTGTPPHGNIAFFSQSGALCQAILDWALGENMGFSKFVSLGNKAVLNEAHMLQDMGSDQETDVILGYIENVTNGRDFLEYAQSMSKNKPVIMIKSGTSTAGAQAASSHTGAIAGSDQAYQAAFEKSGIFRVHDISSLFTLAQAFSTQPLPQGPNLAIVTNSGGPGIMTADACEGSSLNITRLSEETISQLQEFLPSFASLHNPVDIIGDADAKRYKKTLQVVAKDHNVNALMVIITPTGTLINQMEECARDIIEVSKEVDLPIFTCFLGKKSVLTAQEMLRDANIPCYNFPDPAIFSLDAMYKYTHWKYRPHEEPETFTVDTQKADSVRKKARDRQIGNNAVEIVEFQAQEILQAYGLPIPETYMACRSTEAAMLADKIGYPVVLKIASQDISHKSDVNGVKTNLNSAEEVKRAFTEITSRAITMKPKAQIRGCLIQKMVPKDVKEIIVGFKRDEQFGPLLMFGLGGIYVEVLRDIAFRLAPVTRTEVKEMIRSIRSYMLLKGVRGEKEVNMEQLEEIILKMSQFSMDYPDISEAEFNPVLINDEQAWVSDVRLLLE
ncbi:MAG: acetate--CoA ligase family protein [Thermodesulfobacteriota bacterium]